jgi:hypothetical protein
VHTTLNVWTDLENFYVKLGQTHIYHSFKFFKISGKEDTRYEIWK